MRWVAVLRVKEKRIWAASLSQDSTTAHVPSQLVRACACMYIGYVSCNLYLSNSTNAGDSQDAFHTSIGVFANNHTLDKPFIIQSANTVNHNNAQNLPDAWSCGATPKGSMTVDLFMSLCVHHVENNLKTKGYGAGGKASILIFDGHASRWSYAGLMYLMANNCWPFCLASHTSSWAQVNILAVGVSYG